MANQLDKPHDFEVHVYGCKKCASVDTQKPATLVNCCLIGAPLLRDYLHSIMDPIARKRAAAIKKQFTQSEGKNHNTTKKKLKEAMKYK